MVAVVRADKPEETVLIVAANRMVELLLQRVYSLGASLGLSWQRDWEQSALAHMYREGDVETRAAFCIVPPTVLQSFYRDYGVAPAVLWRPTHFAAHVTGLDESKLRRMATCVAELAAAAGV